MIKFTFAAALLLCVSTRAADVTELMWGLHNRGTPVSTYLNPLQSYKLQAVAGEDIHPAPAVQGRKVKVAIIDTGVDLEQPQLSSFIFKNANKCEDFKRYKACLDEKGADAAECRENFLQAAENVYPADCQGWNLLDKGIKPTPNNILGRPDLDDTAGHGTHVAGIVVSVSKNAEIIPVKVIGEGPNQPMKAFSIDLSPNENQRKGYQSDGNLSERVSRAIIYAMNTGAEVINLSIGWPENQNTDIIKEAIAEAQRRGIIVVAAAGNDSTNALLRPCQYKGVICVGAHGPDGALASFSNFGFGVDIAAPGSEIVSTIPTRIRSLRLPGVRGFDLMSGTSQAAPFVTGVVAELLARGIPSREIYARLMLGAREVKPELPLLVGPVGGRQQTVDASTKYKKTVLSGLLDMTNALRVREQSLILPADKDVQVINWDRKSADLNFKFSLKNYWQEIKGRNVQIKLRANATSEIEPHVISVTPMQNTADWKSGEEKSFAVNLRIADAADPSQSRLPSELSYQVQVLIDGALHRQFEIKAEVIVSVNAAVSGAGAGDVFGYDLVGEIPRDMKLSLIDEVLDAQKTKRDYFAYGKDEANKGTFNISLVRNSGKDYVIEKIQNLKFDGDISMTRPQYKIRLDMDGDGMSEYIFGVIEYLDKEAGMYGDYRNHFYIFDNAMNLKKYVVFDDKRAALPYTFYWMKINGQMRPAWVGKGQEVVKKWDITDLWSTDGNAESVANSARTKSDIRFYYLDENFKLAQIDARKQQERIVDVVQGSGADAANGVLNVLIAVNSGSEVRPSYVNEFSIGKVQNGKLENVMPMKSISGAVEYRNLVDTFADKTKSLKAEADEFRGMMWYGLDSNQRQRVTMVDLETQKLTDKLISSQRRINDSALLVKAGFQSAQRKGVFLITNSELEYHDLNNDEVVSRSLNRYSFFGDSNFVELYFPITLNDRTDESQKLPALFTTEQSALSKGIRLLTPIYDKSGHLKQMVTPARLRLKAEQGCRPLESPVFMGDRYGYGMDYLCGKKLVRFMLKY